MATRHWLVWDCLVIALVKSDLVVHEGAALVTCLTLSISEDMPLFGSSMYVGCKVAI